MANLQLTLIDGGSQEQSRIFDVSAMGCTIGRSKDCDWVLHDTDRFISNKHIMVSFRSECFYLTDLSSNGVFVNGSDEAIGKGNTYPLAQSDIINLGKFRILVNSIDLAGYETSTAKMPVHASLNNPLDQASNMLNQGAELDAEQSLGQGLLDIINSSNTSTAGVPSASVSPSSAFGNSHTKPSDSHEQVGDLGLFEILNGKASTQEQVASPQPDATQAPNYTLTGAPSHSVHKHQQAHQKTSTNVIPDDWDLDEAKQFDNTVKPTSTPILAPTVNDASGEKQMPKTPLSDSVPSAAVSDEAVSGEAVPIEAIPSQAGPSPTIKHPAKQNETPSAQTNANSGADNSQAFFDYLYDKLNLPAEYKHSVDPITFADDLVNILGTSTQGIMALLAGRSVFKQESRLNMTMIKPQSNNPIKFSLDPTDTLEMLLVKKRAGYLSAQAAYSEALNDIQAHQMAFIGGLQATLKAVMEEMSPALIQASAEQQSKSFMALNKNGAKWDAFVAKQAQLNKQISENLNDILSNYFSPAYEQHINNAKHNETE